MQQPLDAVVELHIEEEEEWEVLENRIRGRWFHMDSGRSYHDKFCPPKESGKDDITGENLVRRADDTAEILKTRLEQYHRLTAPLVGYYSKKGSLKAVDASRSIKEVTESIKSIFNRQAVEN